MLCSLIGFSLQRESERGGGERERASEGSRNRREGAYSIPRNTQANKSISYFLSLLSFSHWTPGRREGGSEEQRGEEQRGEGWRRGQSIGEMEEQRGEMEGWRREEGGAEEREADGRWVEKRGAEER